MPLKATIVFEKNWAAMHVLCEVCYGSGLEDNISCSWCGDGQTPDTPGSGNKYKYIINRGSSRSSKTRSIIDCYDLYCREERFKRMSVWRDTKKDCKDTVLKDMIKHLKQTDRWKKGFNFHITESIFTYTTDSTIEICGTDDEEKVHGFEQDCAWTNEPYKISRDTFDQIDMRTSDFIFIDYNPKKGHWVEDVMKDERAIVIDSTFKDNPFCPPEQRKKILSYQPVRACRLVEDKELTEADANRYNIDTNPNGYSKRDLNELARCRRNEHQNSASLFNWQVYGLGTKGERPNRIFRWKEIPDEEFHNFTGTELTITDWGKVDPWAIMHLKYSDGRLLLHELNYASENEIRGKMTSTELAQIEGDDEGIVTWLFNKIGIPKDRPVICDTNRPLKIAILRRMGWEAYGAGKVKGSVIDGIDLLDNLEVCYTKSSINIAYEQENYSRKEDTNGQVLEEPEDMDNHHMDCARYGALYLQSSGRIRII